MKSCSRDNLFLDTSAPENGAVLASNNLASSNLDLDKESLSVQIQGTPRWLDAELATQSDNEGVHKAIADAYIRFGDGLLKYLSGDFALIVHDRNASKVLAATDRMGRFPLYYREQSGHITLSSRANLLIGTDSLEFDKISPQGVYNYVYFHMIPAPGSFYQGVGKLGAAEQLLWDGSSVTRESYWTPRFQAHSKAPQSDLAAELRTQLKSAVARRITDPESLGAFLSGGLDSSTVAGMLSECLDGEVQAFAIGFDAPGYDEMAYARITARHFGIKLHELYVTPDDIVAALPDIVRAFDEPFGNSSALPAYYCAQMAKNQGVRHLLAGDGGDELFAGNERYAKQKVFEHYGKLPASVRNNVVEPLANRLPETIPLARKARSYIEQANVPLPDRLQSYNFLHRHAPPELFGEHFLANVDTDQPLRLLREVYGRPSEGSTLDRLLYLDWQITLADNDLRKVRQSCEYAGVEVSFPMLDDELTELSLTIPDHMKLPGSRLRHFYKESLRGWLPDETIAKSKHGFGLPFGVWMQTHQPLKEMALDNLSALKKREWFNPRFIDHAMELHRSGHASYYGELVWILMVLELWLSAREQEGRALLREGARG